MQRLFFVFYAVLFFFTPLILWPYTSEVFEFNKIIFVYIMTILIGAAWIVRCINERKIIFSRTILDIPFIIFFGIQTLSTLFSIDPRTSFLGYYSRFNGGLSSTVCYLILYWAFVSNIGKKESLNSAYYLLASAVLVSIYGILERFGIDKNIWVQDVVNRVFSTLGQPNWLAAFLIALIPLTFTSLIKKPYTYILSALFFTTLLFTKSRSGLLGFAAAEIIFWGYYLTKKTSVHIKNFLIHNFIFLAIFIFVGSPFSSPPTPSSAAPSLETGGTESGEIRKIVWKGAVEIWRHYPILGTGPETFAYSYYRFRPAEHNLVSEWDFIYNKAHNEYLNLAANTGSLGLIGYLVVIGASLVIFIKNSRIDLFAGYTALLVSNFFGFSVVPTQLILFLFPAFALKTNDK